MYSKPWYQSKTVWFNVIGGVLVLAQYLGTIHIGDPRIIEGIMALGNFLLRFATDTSIGNG